MLTINMYVWDKSGNLMFDALGLTDKGIQREIIRNDMVSQDANISANKLDIESLFNIINEDGSHTIKSTKILVDDKGQKLDVAFKQMTTNVESALSDIGTIKKSLNTVTDTISTQGTQITAIQGQISSKVWQQDITTAVTNLQVGGRNLIVGTSSANANSGWSQNGWSGSFTTYNSKERTYKLVANSGWHVARYTSLPDYIGKQVTISFKSENVKDETTATSTWALFITNKTGSNPYVTSYLTGDTPKQDYWQKLNLLLP